MADVRVGIIGLNANSGQAGRSHVPAILALDGLTLAGVANRTLANSQEAAAKWNIPHVFNSVEELVASPEIDLVVISTPVPSHYELVKQALEAGKHVVCEWPFAANLDEATELNDLAHSKGVVTGMGLQGRGTPDLNQLKDMIADGYVGEPVAASLLLTGGGADSVPQRIAWWAKRENGANMLTIPAAHNLDALRYVLGPVTAVTAVARTQVKQPKVQETGEAVERTSFDNLVLSAEFESGALAAVHAQSVPVHQTGMLFEVHGTEGALVARHAGGLQGGGLDMRGARRGEQSFEPIEVDEQHRHPAGTPEGPGANFMALYRGVAAAINGGPAVEPNFDTAVSLHRLLDAIERSSASGERVEL